MSNPTSASLSAVLDSALADVHDKKVKLAKAQGAVNNAANEYDLSVNAAKKAQVALTEYVNLQLTNAGVTLPDSRVYQSS